MQGLHLPPPMTKNDPAPNINSGDIEKLYFSWRSKGHGPGGIAQSVGFCHLYDFPFSFSSLSTSLSLSLASQEPNSSPCLRVHNSTIIFSSKIILSNTNMPLESHPLFQAIDQLISPKYHALLKRNSGKHNSTLLLNICIKELLTWEVEEA